jgi:catechol 2,3-dioxygenase-like lactoylglutathione lyase family enzyme
MSRSELVNIADRALPQLRAGILRQVSHLAIRTEQMGAVRSFYEGFLGLPMVTSLVADVDPQTGGPSNYIHCFFQMADGSCIAFFQCGKGLRGPPTSHTSDALERHLALRVDEKEEVDGFLDRAKAFGIEGFVIDHEDFYSFYTYDPDGDCVEITWHKPSISEINDPVAAHRILDQWLIADAA